MAEGRLSVIIEGEKEDDVMNAIEFLASQTNDAERLFNVKIEVK